MTIPPQIDAMIPGLVTIMGQFAESYRRDMREATGRDCYPNWEAGMLPLSAIAPGLSVAVERYNVGGEAPGWFMWVRFTDGTETMQKVIDNGPGGFGSDWALVGNDQTL